MTPKLAATLGNLVHQLLHGAGVLARVDGSLGRPGQVRVGLHRDRLGRVKPVDIQSRLMIVQVAGSKISI